MLSLKLFFLLIIYFIQNITVLIAQSDCSYNVNVGMVTYTGCKDSVSTDSLESQPVPAYDVYSFKGIPYAQPPIGNLRFRETQPLTYLEPTNISCTAYGKSCIQPPLDSNLENFYNASEDCLTCNIWTKSLSNSSNLPVMVFVHGGAFLWGGSRNYDGTQLALRDVVLVSMNYRLGAFGFFCTNSTEAPGNQGLYDQTMALIWVKQNIRAFGGNPDNITLFGHSAGSMSVSNLIVSAKSNYLFDKVIMQSGASMASVFSRSLDYSDAQARRFASDSTVWLSASKPGPCLGSDYINCLRNKSSFDILQAQSFAFLWNPSKPWYSADLLEFVPCFGDPFIPVPLNKSLETGTFRPNLTIIIGHVEMEGTLFAQLFDLVRLLGLRYQPNDILTLSGLYNTLSPLFSNAIVQNGTQALFSQMIQLVGVLGQRPSVTSTALGCNNLLNAPTVSISLIQSDIRNSFFDNNTNSIGDDVAQKYTQSFQDFALFSPSLSTSSRERYRIRGAASHSLGDFLLTCPTIMFGKYLVKSQNFIGKLYQYRLTYANKKSPCYGSCWCNATHYDDVPLVFGFPYMTTGDYSDTDRNFSTKIMELWTGFAKNGAPGTVNGNVWPTYNKLPNGDVNITYIELNPDSKKFGRTITNVYNGQQYTPSVIMNCQNYWDKILSGQFGF